MAKKKKLSAENETVEVKFPKNFNQSDEILCGVYENEDGVYSVYLKRCKPGSNDTFYHSFEEIQNAIGFPVDFSHLNPLHVLPCGFYIETQPVIKEEVTDAPIHSTGS